MTNYSDHKIISEGKAKILYASEDISSAIHFFKDSFTAFNNQKRGEMATKGIINNTISCHLMELLGRFGVATHHIEKIDDRTQYIKLCKIVPVEVTIRNYYAENSSSFAKRCKLPARSRLPGVVCEYFLKDDSLGDPMISSDYIVQFGLATAAQLSFMKEKALYINTILSSYLWKCGLILADFKLEFGILPNGEIVVADEISPDTCRLWDAITKKSYDKDVFRFETDNYDIILDAYITALHRIVS